LEEIYKKILSTSSLNKKPHCEGRSSGCFPQGAVVATYGDDFQAKRSEFELTYQGDGLDMDVGWSTAGT
jgi:hypothetical protein